MQGRGRRRIRTVATPLATAGGVVQTDAKDPGSPAESRYGKDLLRSLGPLLSADNSKAMAKKPLPAIGHAVGR